MVGNYFIAEKLHYMRIYAYPAHLSTRAVIDGSSLKSFNTSNVV